MEITQLHYFKTVARYENFTHAAEELHITQSALSRSIAALEEDIGFQLFERKRGGRISLNREGRFFLTHVVRILNTLEQTVTAVKDMSGLDSGTVNIAVSESIFLKNIIYQFILDHPDVRVSCQLQSQEQMKTSLEDGVINFAVCKEPLDSPELTWIPIFQDRMTVLLNRSHPLADRKSIPLHLLKDDHFVISNLGYDMDSEILPMCHRAGFEPYVTYQGTGEDLPAMLAAQNIGVLLVPYSVSASLPLFDPMSNQRSQQLVNIPISDSFACSEIGIAMRHGQFQSDAALELYDRIVDCYRQLVPCTI